ncbi:MAG: serine/threonine-protein kinase [Kofleriaceae bacterium]|nr:serine/threonine-protein kinase [Kofleriaceae bacterium]
MIGRGGMGLVVAAHDPQLGRPVAIKILHDVGVGDPEVMQAAVRREAQALARVDHPHVVAVYDAGVDGAPFLVMQRVDGDTLDAHVRTHRPAAPAVLALFAQAGRGVAAIHAAGLVHRDLKPENLMIDRAGVVRVSDLGLAHLGELTAGAAREADAGPGPAPTGPASPAPASASRAVGTPGYLAPEVLAGASATAASDQFAFCVALWECLLGSSPFPGASAAERAAAAAAGRLVEPAPGRLTAPVLQLLRRGLAYAPSDRFPSMTALVAELERRPRWSTWRRGAAGGALVATLAAIGLLLVPALRREHRPANPGPAIGSGAAADPPPALAIDEASLRRLTATEACDEYPAFGPDGTLYYDAPVGADTWLFALAPGGGPPRVLTRPTGWDLAPAPSPDGRWLAYVHSDDRGMNAMIGELADLGHARQLALGSFRPTWSPDGRAVWAGRRGALQRLDPATGAVSRTLTPPDGMLPLHGHELADGRFVLLTGNGATWADGVAVYAAGATEARWLIAPSVDNSFEEVLTLGPDGTGLIISEVTVSGPVETWWVPLDGSPRRRLFGSAVAARKRLALRGDEMVWSDCAEHATLARVDLTGPTPTLRDLSSQAWVDMQPVAASAGDQLFFISDRSGPAQIWRGTSSTSAAATLVPFGDLELDQIEVSADGVMLAASSETGVYAGPVDGSTPPRQLLPAAEYDRRMTFSRDHDRLLVEQGVGGERVIVAVPITGGAAERVVDAVAFAPAMSPSADVLAYLTTPTGADGSRYRPMLLDLRTGRARPLASAVPAAPWTDLRWDGAGRRLLVSRRDGETIEVEVATDRILRRFSSGADMLSGLTYLGDDIIVGRIRWSGELWSARLR